MEILMASNLRMGKALIDQFFCHYSRLEEYQAGMWRRVPSREFAQMVAGARSFMMDTGKFSEAMGDVCREWENSCKVNFTDASINPVAWLGQAAVCKATGIPERCTRGAWMELPDEARVKANASAKRHIEAWRKEYIGQGELFK
jgi:hypothetical protein